MNTTENVINCLCHIAGLDVITTESKDLLKNVCPGSDFKKEN